MEQICFAGIWILAGFINGISGMGAALVAVPFMTLFMDIQLIVPLSCILVTILSSVLAIKYRSEFHVKIILPALFCAVPGAVLGSYFLKILFFAYFGTCYGVYLNRLCRVEFHAKI